MTRSGGPSPAEEHLGDRLAALVDGELGHDARERVLAHLATCPRCKAEADAQRQLKNILARTASPPPSDSLLARLQGLPAGGIDEDRGDRGGDGRGGPFGGPGVFGAREEAFAFLPTPPRERGFRIHEVERPSPRGRRFAFAAAGAVSLAAFALGGAMTLDGDVGGPASRNRADGQDTGVPASQAEPAGAASRPGGYAGSHPGDVALLALTGGRQSLSASGGSGPAAGLPGARPPSLLRAYDAAGLPSDILPPVVQPVLSAPADPAAVAQLPPRVLATSVPTQPTVPPQPGTPGVPFAAAGAASE